MAREVYLHVGPAKSGTTYLQQVMHTNRDLLRRNGVLFPGGHASHFLAALDLKGAGFKGYEYPDAEGEWDRVASAVSQFAGQAVISHETLARASRAVIDDAVASFPDSRVRVVITCRDLGRQIPAMWQENVKNRNVRTYTEFVGRVLDTWANRQTSARSFFWGGQHLQKVAARWSRAVGEENVRLVTVPPPGAPSDELWKRFARATDLPMLDYDSGIARNNVSLGVSETELLRRLNGRMPADQTWPEYEQRIKGGFVPAELRADNPGAKLTVPEERRGPVERIAEEMISDLQATGYEVFGDLADLRPSFAPMTSLPDDVSADELLGLSLQILARMASRGGRPNVDQLSGRQAARVVVRKALSRLGLRH